MNVNPKLFIILLIFFILILFWLKVEVQVDVVRDLEKRVGVNTPTFLHSKPIEPHYEEFIATAYDLSYNSCQKWTYNKGYGITSTGINLIGKSRTEAMVVAVDPTVIPYGTKLEIEFPEMWKDFNGIYIAGDSGGAIKGDKIDVFMGDFNVPDGEKGMTKEVAKFGVQKVKIRRIRNE